MSEMQGVTAEQTNEAPVDSGSLSDHESQYGPKRQTSPLGDMGAQEPAETKAETSAADAAETPAQKEARERDEQGRFTKPPKHRAEKDKARPEDVPRIRELTSRLRAAESELERLRRPEIQQQSAKIQKEAPQFEALAFNEGEPTLDQFEKDEDPYGAYLKAWSRWDRRKEAHEERQRQAVEQAKQGEAETVRQAEEEFQRAMGGYQERLAPFREAHPDFDELLAEHATFELTPLAQATILLHDQGPEVVYYLLQHPEMLDEVHLLTDGKPITEQNVAMATRWLDRRRQPVQDTGSGAPARQVKHPPPPPNPVRTVPNRDTTSSSDDLSLAEHERLYGRRR